MAKKSKKVVTKKSIQSRKKLMEIINWEMRHKLDKKLDEEPVYKVIKWARQNGLSVGSATMSDYKKLRKEQALQDIINNDPSFKKGEVKERPDEAIEFFRDSQYDLTKETIGREMNLVNGVIKAMQQRLSDPKQLRSIPTDDLMKAALSAVKIKSSIMGPDAYKYEVHFQKLQEKMEAVLEIINQEVEEETRLRIFERLQEMHMEEVRRGQDE